MAEYIIYTSNNCSFCENAKGLLDRRKLDYEERNISNEDNLKFLYERGFTAVPQVFDGDRYIGGYDNLIDYMQFYGTIEKA